MPAWTSATRVPPPRSALQCTASLRATAQPWSRTLRPRSKSAWNADAVGSDWPWYLEPSSLEPYGRSTGELIRKKLIWPMRIPW